MIGKVDLNSCEVISKDGPFQSNTEVNSESTD